MNRISIYAIGLLPLFTSPVIAATLTPGAPLELTGTQGKFDFIKIDEVGRRLLACHSGNGSLDVIDIDSARLIKSIPTGAAQGVAIDEKNHRYFVSVSKPTKMVIIDSVKLEMTGEIPLPGPVDVLAYSPALDRVFVCNDEQPVLWAIDPEEKKIVSTLTLPGAGMEDLGFDSSGTFLFQNLKDTSAMAKIDPKSMTVIGTWPTAPAEKPHGLAMIPEADAVLVAGGTGQLVLMNLGTGKVTAKANIAPRVDEIAYDPGLHRAYCASGTGVISAVDVTKDSLTTIDSIPSAQGAHSIAVDPQSHTVWITYAKDTKAFAQPFTLTSKAAAPQN